MTDIRATAVVQHPLDVLERARCLVASALVAVGGEHPEVVPVVGELADGMGHALTPLERRALAGHPLESGELARLSWQTVSAAVLLWALRRLEDPPRGDRAPEGRTVVDRLLTEPTITGDDRLRPIGELRGCARHAGAWMWRVRDEQLCRATGRTSDEQAVARNARAVYLLDGRTAPVEEDLGVDGRALRDVDDRRLEELAAIGTERLRAARWLLGGTIGGHRGGFDADVAWDAVRV